MDFELRCDGSTNGAALVQPFRDQGPWIHSRTRTVPRVHEQHVVQHNPIDSRRDFGSVHGVRVCAYVSVLYLSVFLDTVCSVGVVAQTKISSRAQENKSKIKQKAMYSSDKQLIRFKAIHADSISNPAYKSTILPTRGTSWSAGLDLHFDIGRMLIVQLGPYSMNYEQCVAYNEELLQPDERKVFRTGVSVAIPKGYYGRIAPRSSLAFKYGIDVLAGVVDSDYRDEIKVILINHGTEDVRFKHGERIAQLVIERVHMGHSVFVDSFGEDEKTERKGGFGSTGK